MITLEALASELEQVREEARRSTAHHQESVEALSRRIDELEKQVAFGRAETRALEGKITELRDEIRSLRSDIQRVAELAREARQAASDNAEERKQRDEAAHRHIDTIAKRITQSDVDSKMQTEAMRRDIHALSVRIDAVVTENERQNIELAAQTTQIEKQTELLIEARDERAQARQEEREERARARLEKEKLERWRTGAKIGTVMGAFVLMGLGVAMKWDEKAVIAIPGAIGWLAYQLLGMRKPSKADGTPSDTTMPPPALNK